MSDELPYRFPTEEEEREGLAAPPVPAEPEIDKSGPIRRFLDSGIQERLDAALKAVPEGKAGAVVAYANNEGARLAVLGRVPSIKGLEWSVVMDKPWHGAVEAEAIVRYSW